VGLDLGVVEETGDLVAVEAQSDVFITGHPEQLFHVRGGEVDLDTPRILVVADLEPERAGLAFGQSGLEDAPRDDRGERLVDRIGRRQGCVCVRDLHVILLGSLPNLQDGRKRQCLPTPRPKVGSR